MFKKKIKKEDIIQTVSIKLNKDQCITIIDSLLYRRNDIQNLTTNPKTREKDLKDVEDLLEHIKNS